ncbi:hypothetical protein C8Q73DRAFT_669104 [Cubamyces lactineus]|nr:hypothetical protein C8Q73DRAFT_669104 [Cubamyces lactineus]
MQEQSKTKSSDEDSDEYWDDEPELEDEYWDDEPELEDETHGNNTTQTGSTRSHREQRRDFLTQIKVVVIVSILLHNRDQQCNTLQSVTGLFLHSCGTPEKVVKVLSHMGLSISLSSIHAAVHSLAACSSESIEALVQMLLTSYAFDNLDTKVPLGIPTVDKPADGLIHITTGTLLRLEHGVKLDNLCCARLLWDRSELNPNTSDPRPFDAHATLRHLVTLHLEPDFLEDGLSRRGRFRAWFLTDTLFKHGPTSLAVLRECLPHPEPIDMIPGGVGDPHAGSTPGSAASTHPSSTLVDISEYVTLMHGDLGTYEKILSCTRRRKQEQTPYNRLQSVVFLQPNDSSRLVNNAKFRKQHDLIHHVLTLLLLDAWRVEVKKRWNFNTLEAWAASSPAYGDVEEAARSLVWEHIEGNGQDLYKLRMKSAAVQDQVKKNTMRMLNYLLLYEELSYTMNAGCIGQVETLFPVWIQIFRAVGKHKYANLMLRFMHALYKIYPEGLCRAIRYNMLVNPSGKLNAFHAVDWIVELLNLYIKVCRQYL